MTDRDYANLAADLKRISDWMMKGGSERLIELFLERNMVMFKGDTRKIRGRMVSWWLDEIGKWRKNREGQASRSLRLSDILIKDWIAKLEEGNKKPK